MSKCPQDSDADVKMKMREEYAAGPMKGYFDHLAAIAGENAGGFVLGDFSIADLAIMGILDMVPLALPLICKRTLDRKG